MSKNVGTLVAAAVRPNDSLDLIAVAIDNELKGTVHSCDSTSDRDATIESRRSWGMLCAVKANPGIGLANKTYQLAYGNSDTNINNNANWVEFGYSGYSGYSGSVGATGASGYSGSPNRISYVKLVNDASYLSSGDGKFYFCIPSELNGLSLINIQASVSTSSSSGIPTYQINNSTTSHDLLSTMVTIDVGETSSYTAVVPAVINPTYKTVHTGDMIRIDKKVSGTGEKGDSVIFTFQYV